MLDSARKSYFSTIMDKSLGTLGRFPIHTGQTLPLTHKQCWTPVCRIFSNFKFVWGGGRENCKNISKGMHCFRRQPRNDRKIWILQHCPKDFSPGLWLHETREIWLNESALKATPTRASAFKCPVIFNFEIYFQAFQMKKLGCNKCLQQENLHLRHLPFLGKFGQRYLWIDKSNGRPLLLTSSAYFLTMSTAVQLSQNWGRFCLHGIDNLLRFK